MNKKIITLILALAAVCGCQKTEKTIYRVPLSEHAMELERQEKAYNDSIEKYSALRFLLSLHPGGKGKQSDFSFMVVCF